MQATVPVWILVHPNQQLTWPMFGRVVTTMVILPLQR